MKVNITTKKELSKKTNIEYSVLLVELINDKGERILIQDYGKEIPYDLENLDVTISKNDKGFYIINELDYAIPFKYNLAINLLNR